MRSSLSFIVYNSPSQPQCELKRPSRLYSRVPSPSGLGRAG
jgi:hypothetical protein